ncbi:hypothetical protein QW131_22300 [Roseibium salinum]|nr:hypothetical protein [Roseibium salinum]
MFHWLGEVSPYGQYFYRLAGGPDIGAQSIDDLRNLDVKIGVQDGSNLHAYLKQLGFEGSGNLVPVTDYHQEIEMLFRGRVDLIPIVRRLGRSGGLQTGI